MSETVLAEIPPLGKKMAQTKSAEKKACWERDWIPHKIGKFLPVTKSSAVVQKVI